MARILAFVILSLLVISSLCAQSPPNALEDQPAAHMHHPQVGIDGANNPEQIPDSTAYRLFLITVSEVSNPTSERQERQIAFLKSSGLDDSDINRAIPVLAEFKAEYGNLIEDYNASAAAADAKDATPDIVSFLRSREQLVQKTRDALAAALSSGGMTRLHDHVENEKRKMQIAAREGQ